MNGVARRIANGGRTPTDTGDAKYDVVIVGAGAGGISVAASLQARKSRLSIAIIDPADIHYYQPGWTMVGGGIFDAKDTAKTMGSLIPRGVKWVKAAVAAFEPENNAVILDGCRVVKYDRLVVCPGLKLDWGAIEGLEDTLGRNGVTSNYRYDLAPYTWQLVQELKEGRALFTQPPMPIKCAGAPQKALYLSGDAWFRNGALKDIDIQFMNAGGVLFGVKDYVPALMDYIQKYDASLNFFHNLIAVDGPAKKATFKIANPDTDPTELTVAFDMMLAGRSAVAQYDGYGSCPLTVERGKIVLAEFGYGGVLKPSFPKALLDGTKPTRAAWFLKEKILPPIYWKGMLRGKEWMAKPEPLKVASD